MNLTQAPGTPEASESFCLTHDRAEKHRQHPDQQDTMLSSSIAQLLFEVNDPCEISARMAIIVRWLLARSLLSSFVVIAR